ncbi:RND efflux transporter [Striga asiatica]|uniref:RND efflux transporter n=1 Tax=Striga asiatica TaxID=4170 RepID=A0A5A7RKH8_STRAF|nr:RND efflux transporter [Striga asiatica]
MLAGSSWAVIPKPSEIWSTADRIVFCLAVKFPIFTGNGALKRPEKNQLAVDGLINRLMVCSVDANVTGGGFGNADAVRDGLRTTREGYCVDLDGTENAGIGEDAVADECGGATVVL